MISHQQSNVSAQKRPASFALRPVSRADPVATPKCWEEVWGLFVMEQKQIPRPLDCKCSNLPLGSLMSVTSSSSSLQHPHWSFTRQGPNTSTLQPERHWAIRPFPQPAQDCCSRRQPWLSLLSALDLELLRDKHKPEGSQLELRTVWLGAWPCPGKQVIVPMPHAVTCWASWCPWDYALHQTFLTIFTLVEFHFLWFPMIVRLGRGRRGSLEEPESGFNSFHSSFYIPHPRPACCQRVSPAATYLTQEVSPRPEKWLIEWVTFL